MNGLNANVSIETLRESGVLEKMNQSTSLKPLTAEEQKLIIKRDHPELTALLKEMKEKSEEITNKINPILQKVELRELLTSEVIITIIISINFYIFYYFHYF